MSSLQAWLWLQQVGALTNNQNLDEGFTTLTMTNQPMGLVSYTIAASLHMSCDSVILLCK